MLKRALLTVVLLGALAAPAHAAPSWLPPFTTSPEGLQETFPALASAPDGTAVAAWRRNDGEHLIVEAARRLPGQPFGPAAKLTDPGLDGAAPQVGIDNVGNATVAWEEDVPAPGSGTRVRVARLPAGANAFESPQTLSSSTAVAPAIGVGANGTAVVAFRANDGSDRVMKAAIRDGASGPFGLAKTISAPTDNFFATNNTAVGEVVVGPDGSAVVVWAMNSVAVPARYELQTNERGPNEEFAAIGTTRSPASPVSAQEPTAAIDAAGRITIGWTEVADFNSPSDDNSIRTMTRPLGGGFGSASTASGSGELARGADLAAAADGTVVGVWVTGSGSSRRVEAAVRDPGSASFSADLPLSPAGDGFVTPRVATNAAGDSIVLWRDFDAGAIESARRIAGGGFAPLPEPVNDSAPPAGTVLSYDVPTVALDDQGNATALWLFDVFRSGTHFYRVQGAGFDAVAPTLAASVPPTAVSGAPVGMAAAALDRWGPVALHWAFGDGAAGAGDAVSHAFGAAGAFNVTVTATDAVGNATSATRPIAVAAAPLPRIDSSVSSRWGFDRRKRFIFLLRLRVKAPPKGAVAELRCRGRRCPFTRKRVTRIRRNRIDVFRALSKRQRRFRPRQTLQLRITAPGHIGKVVKFRLRRGKIPSGQTLCLPPGASRPQRRC